MINRHFLLVLFGLAIQSSLIGATVSIPEDPENFHIFLLMGQSNMEGGSAIDGPMDEETHPRILKLNQWNSWELAKDPITNHKSPAIGPGMSFAKKMVEENPDITVGLVPLAVGGTEIAQWSLGSELYIETITAAGIARKKGVIKGILWHQGEHDSFNHLKALAYAHNLRRLINDLRIDLSDVDLPFIIGGLTDSPYINNPIRLFPITWRRLKLVGTTFYNTGYVRSSGAQYYTHYYQDNIHFTSQGQRTMGRRYCDEYLRVAGHWQAQLKERLDNESTEIEEDGWKWSPHIGLYYDTYFPLIKHAQLGWLYLDANADGEILIDSATNGKFKTWATWDDGNEQGWYIYRYDEVDPENDERLEIYYVWLYSDENSENVFYNQATSEWTKTIDEAPDYDSASELYKKAEEEFISAQTEFGIMADNVNNEVGNWTQVTQALKNMEKHRLYCILYALEAVKYAAEHPETPFANFWTQQSTALTQRMDLLFIEGQTLWQAYTNTVHPRG